MEREGGVQEGRGRGEWGKERERKWMRFSGDLGPVGEVARLIQKFAYGDFMPNSAARARERRVDISGI